MGGVQQDGGVQPQPSKEYCVSMQDSNARPTTPAKDRCYAPRAPIVV